MNLRSFAFAILLSLFSTTLLADDLTSRQTQEIDSYISKLINAEDDELYDLANTIRFSGLSDKRLFEKVAEILKKKHQQLLEIKKPDDQSVNQVKILIMALASSGNSEYWVTLNSILEASSNRNVRNRAHESMKNISFYQKRNTIMQNYDSLLENQSLQTKRTLNLLQSDDRKMSRYGAEDIHRIGSTDASVLEWMAAQLELQAHHAENKLHVDMLAWYCKALAKVDKEKYSPLLNKIIKDKSIHSKIRKHAKKALKAN
ncbi:hypothetical protein [Paraglaciecola sp. 2405UD69-4]|uniref:hypothetical protein n=1 Tax=Paraglaciecola sp. 2405UD69-4 TaxID=3391836 RepID=UPI0039C96DB0